MHNVKNNAQSTIADAGGITDLATSLTVAADNFPAAPFFLTIESEIIEVTAKVDTTFTIVRAQDGTTAATHATGTDVKLMIVADLIRELQSAVSKDISFYIPGDVFVTTGIVQLMVGSARIVSKVRLAVASAPTGADLIIDIHKNGTTMFTTQANRPSIVAAATSGYSVAPDITALAEGDVLTIDIDQVGSTLVGTGLSVTVMCQ